MTDDFDQEPLSKEEQVLRTGEAHMDTLVSGLVPLITSFANPEKVVRDDRLEEDGKMDQENEPFTDYRRVLDGDNVAVYDWRDDTGMIVYAKDYWVGGIGKTHGNIRFQIFFQGSRIDWHLDIPNLIDIKIQDKIHELGLEVGEEEFDTLFYKGEDGRMHKTITFPKRVPDDRPDTSQNEDANIRIIDAEPSVDELEVASSVLATFKRELEREKAYREL